VKLPGPTRPDSAVAASYPGRRLSGDKLPTGAELRQREMQRTCLGAKILNETQRAT
jgi:hypothetical protein